MVRTHEGRGDSSPRVAEGAGRSANAVLLATSLKVSRQAELVGADQLPSWLRRLEGMNAPELKAEWNLRFATPAPDIRSRDVLRHVIAWRVQAQIYGGYDADGLSGLRSLIADQSKGKPLIPKPRLRLTPGTVLSREWKGRIHRVTVENAGFSYDGSPYASLSEIARLITGTRWSGPRLFGLEADLK